jgi:dihydroorotase-like cyclic amidohydrolase
VLKISRLAIIPLLASTAVLGAGALPPDGLAAVVIRDVSVLDPGATAWLPHRDIVIMDTSLTSIAPAGGSLPAAKITIHGTGKFAIPGLFDDRVSLANFTRETAGLLIASGITSVRDIGTSPARIAEWRRDIANGKMMGPRIVDACETGCGSPRTGASAHARHDELARLVGEKAATPSAALRAATIDAARALGRATELGSIEIGKRADLLILTGDPLADIRHTSSIDAVIFRGEALTRAHLNLLTSRAAGARAGR